MKDIPEVITFIIMFAWIVAIHRENCALRNDVNALNRIIKRLQAKNGMIADGIDAIRESTHII